jgi:cytochrome c551/c552
MAEPITTALIVGLAAQKFAEGAAGKSAEKLVEKLWTAIATRFAGRKKTEENLAAIEKAKGNAPEVLVKVETVLEAEFVEDEDFRAELEAIVTEIQAVEPERVQKMLVGIKTMKGIKGKDVKQTATGPAVQELLSDIEAESLEFDNLTQMQ